MAGLTAVGTSFAVGAPHSLPSAAEGMSHSFRTPAHGSRYGVEGVGLLTRVHVRNQNLTSLAKSDITLPPETYDKHSDLPVLSGGDRSLAK